MLKLSTKGIISKKSDENYMYVHKKAMKHNFKSRFPVLADKKDRGHKVTGDTGNLHAIKLIPTTSESTSSPNWYDCIMGIASDQ